MNQYYAGSVDGRICYFKIGKFTKRILVICALFTPILVISVFKYRAQCEVQARGVNSYEKWKLFYIYTGDQKVKERYTSQNYGQFRSQVGQDEVILNIFGSKSGYFVDLAANDGSIHSNTFALELYGNWSGLCIEPNFRYIPSHLMRKCTFASSVISDVDGDSVSFLLDGGFGGIVDSDTDNKHVENKKRTHARNFETVSIQTIIRDFNVPNTIDYFSLDVEGAEERVINGFPFDSHKVYVFTIERPNQRVRKILFEHDYAEVGVLGNFGDIMYMLRTMPGFDTSMKSAQTLMMELCSKRFSHYVKNYISMEGGLEGKLSSFPVFLRKEKKWIAAGPRCLKSPVICALELPAWDEEFIKFMQ